MPGVLSALFAELVIDSQAYLAYNYYSILCVGGVFLPPFHSPDGEKTTKGLWILR
jgi:hypothetical protein